MLSAASTASALTSPSLAAVARPPLPGAGSSGQTVVRNSRTPVPAIVVMLPLAASTRRMRKLVASAISTPPPEVVMNTTSEVRNSSAGTGPGSVQWMTVVAVSPGARVTAPLPEITKPMEVGVPLRLKMSVPLLFTLLVFSMDPELPPLPRVRDAEVERALATSLKSVGNPNP